MKHYKIDLEIINDAYKDMLILSLVNNGHYVWYDGDSICINLTDDFVEEVFDDGVPAEDLKNTAN
jgi:hypothetical protein